MTKKKKMSIEEAHNIIAEYYKQDIQACDFDDVVELTKTGNSNWEIEEAKGLLECRRPR